eukprot:Hpha_TRINITY_DN12501_c0_g1::TRINITY_DN12501_c0_g1_i2::g.51216::m.51216
MEGQTVAVDTGAEVFFIRQRVEADPPAQVPKGPDGNGPVTVLGAYASKDMAQFYMDRAITDALRRLSADKQVVESAPGGSKPGGVPSEIWDKLQAANKASDMPKRVPCARAECGYVWVYRKWNVTVKVWVERRIVDAPPAQALF